MRLTKLPWMLVLVVLAATAGARGDFVKADAIDFKSILPAAPAKGSDQTSKELDQILQLQKSRTPEEVARAKSEADLTVWVYSNVLGSWFNAGDLPVTGKFLDEVLRETGHITRGAKTFYGRERPFVIDARVKPCIAVDHSASYPSGHSDAATVFGLILSKMFPDQKEALMARSKQIGDDRVLAGVHFPSDVEAGRTLGEAIFKEMETNPDFQGQLKQSIAECEARRAAK